jgi:hypothetical protein
MLITVNLAPGAYTLYAQAKDTYGTFGDPNQKLEQWPISCCGALASGNRGLLLLISCRGLRANPPRYAWHGGT